MPRNPRPLLKFKVAQWGAIAIAPLVFFNCLEVQARSSTETITLSPQFSPNPIEIQGTGGGAKPAKNIAGTSDTPTGDCTGYANSKPNHTLVLSSFFNALSILVNSPEDTALIIKGPGGVWCNDDYQGKNPGVEGQWLPGTYQIWVTSYAKNRTPSYTLRILERP